MLCAPPFQVVVIKHGRRASASCHHRHRSCFVLETHEPTLQVVALETVIVKQEKRIYGSPIIGLNEDGACKVTRAVSLQMELRVGELGDLLRQEPQNVTLLVQVRKVEQSDVKRLFWRLFELCLHVQLCRHDVLVNHCLSVEVGVSEVWLILIIVPPLLLFIECVVF